MKAIASRKASHISSGLLCTAQPVCSSMQPAFHNSMACNRRSANFVAAAPRSPRAITSFLSGQPAAKHDHPKDDPSYRGLLLHNFVGIQKIGTKLVPINFVRVRPKALLAIMRLEGFGKTKDEDSRQQRAKRASAVLRMFRPRDWGVVDWRTAAMIWALNQKNWDVRQAISLVKADYPTRQKAKDEWDEIDEKIAAEVLNARYRANRTASLPDAADIEMAVFGLSFEVWPINMKIRDSVRQT
jgi:hypothetical protein